MLTREAFERRAAWPQERVHGWAPGNYSCTCGDCGIHYVGDKRSVQCYPCAAKFVPPPRPETIEEIRADRAALRAELERTKEDLERVRRNHLRRMHRDALEWADRMIWNTPDEWVMRNRPRLLALASSIRAALERKDGA